MRLYEFNIQLKNYIAHVRLNNGAMVTACERTCSMNYARLIFQHKYGKNNVFSVSEINDTVIDEATKTLTPQQLQVKALDDQEQKLKQQKKQLVARQAMAKAQEKLRDASKSVA